MAALYTMTIDDGGGGADYSFAVQPEIVQRDVERIYRMDLSPVTLGAVEREWVLRCAIDAASATATVTALHSFLTTYIHVRVGPKFFQLLDEAGSVVSSSIGALTNVSNAWEDVRITGYELDEIGGGKPEQLVAGASFTLTVRARQVYADSNGIWYREQRWKETADEGGGLTRRLTTHIKISEAKFAAGTRIANLITTAGMALTKPIAWRWAAPSDHATGAAIDYPRYPLLTEAYVESAITNGSAGGAVNANGNVVHSVHEDRLRGVNRVTLDVTVTGGANPLTDAEASKPAGGVGSTHLDQGKNEATGTWATWADNRQVARAVTGVSVMAALTGGTPLVVAEPRTGGFQPAIRYGPLQPWALEETIHVYGRGAVSLDDLPIPPVMDASVWVLAAPPTYGLPRPEIRGGDSSSTVWVSTVSRRYLWRGDGSPFADAGFRASVMNHYQFDSPRGLVDYG